MSSNLPSLLGNSGSLPRRDLARLGREVAIGHGRAHVIAERGRANAQAIENVAIDAMQASTQVSRHATALASVAPVAEPMLRSILEQTGLALGQVVTDTARSLR